MIKGIALVTELNSKKFHDEVIRWINNLQNDNQKVEIQYQVKENGMYTALILGRENVINITGNSINDDFTIDKLTKKLKMAGV